MAVVAPPYACWQPATFGKSSRMNPSRNYLTSPRRPSFRVRDVQVLRISWRQQSLRPGVRLPGADITAGCQTFLGRGFGFIRGKVR